MSLFAFLFIGGLTLKGILILTKLSIDRLSLKYDTKIISIHRTVEHGDFTLGNQIETEVITNPLKPLARQIYMSAVPVKEPSNKWQNIVIGNKGLNSDTLQVKKVQQAIHYDVV